MIATGLRDSSTRKGLLLALLFMLAGPISLIGLLQLDLSSLRPLQLLVAVLIRTLLQTGLFIVAHDAMHGLLVPGSRRWNDRLGGIALALYAALPYDTCRRKHQRHHALTASASDPDFHPDPQAGFIAWYVRFMGGYLTSAQMLRLLGGWGVLGLVACRISPTGGLNLLVFGTLPLLLSSLQLFGFGTYLPHRDQRAPRLRPVAASLDLPEWLSLLACFHFCYHQEHHQNPGLAWFELPAQRRLSRRLAPAGSRS